ncbi:hypothetical protein [Nonomuraea sp. NPDC003754]
MALWRGSPGWHVEPDTVTSDLRLGGRHHHVKVRDNDPTTRVTTNAVFIEYFEPDVFVARQRITGDPGIDQATGPRTGAAGTSATTSTRRNTAASTTSPRSGPVCAAPSSPATSKRSVRSPAASATSTCSRATRSSATTSATKRCSTAAPGTFPSPSPT